MKTVRVNPHSDPGTAEQDTACQFAFGDGFRHRRAEIRIIIGGVQLERTEINGREAGFRQKCGNLFFEFKSAVIRCDSDFASGVCLPVCDFLHDLRFLILN